MTNLSSFVKRLRDIMRNDAGINGDAQRIEQIAWMLFLKVYDAKEQDWEFAEDDYVSIIPEPCRWCNWAHDETGKGLTGDALLNFVNNTLFPVLKGKDITDGNGNVLIRGVTVTAETPIKKAIVQTTFADANQYMKDGVLLRQVLNIIDELDLSDYEESHAFGEIYETILKELQSAGSAGEFYTPRAVTEFMAQRVSPKIGETMADFACGTGGFITSWLKQLQPQIKSTADAEKYGASIYGIEKKQFPYMLCITNLLLHGLDVPRVYHDNSLLKDVLDYTDDDRFDVILMNPPYGGSEKAEVKNHFPGDLASSETADLFMSVIMYRLKENGRAAVVLPDGFLFGTDNAKINIKKKLLSEFNLHTVVRMPGSVFSPYTSITTNILFFDRTGPTKETWFYRLDMPEGYKHFSKTKPMKLEHFDPVAAWWNDRQPLNVDGFDKARCFTVEELSGDLGYNLDQCGFPHEEEEILAPMDLIRRYQEERASLNAVVDNALTSFLSGLSGNAASELPSIATGALGRLSEIDKDFPDKMRKSILLMAIQGKLVEQRQEEGTGEELYKQIQAEKQALIKAGKIKKEKPLPEITEDEIPFEIPENWKWVRIGKVFNLQAGKNVTSSDIFEDSSPEHQYRCFGGNGCRGYVAGYNRSGHYALIGRQGALCGNINYADGLFYATEHAVVVEQFAETDVLWCGYFLTALNLNQYATATAQPGLAVANINQVLIPLPPLAEQKRIVTKLEELLPLCERLK